MKTETKRFNLVTNNAILEQLTALAKRQQTNKSKIIKQLINQAYLDLVTSQR